MSALPSPLIPMTVGAAVFVGYVALSRLGGSPAQARRSTAKDAPRSRYGRTLAAAGLADARARAIFALVHAGATAAGLLAGAWLAPGPAAAAPAKLILASLGGWIGWWIPMSWAQGRATQRRVDLLTEFPVALDLLQIALEGGMGLDAAWADVASQLSRGQGGLAQEMAHVELEVRFGTTWSNALEAATERTGLAEFRSLGSLLEQTERFGTEMARMIAVMSDSLRHDDVQAIEERAHRASVMLLLPLAGLLLPGSLILMFAPPFILLVEGIGGATP